MNGDAILTVTDVEKRFGDSFALRLERLQVHRGETFCLLGPTGAGKSTLLKILAGLEPAVRGSIVFDGRPVRSEDVPVTLRRRITMVHQRPQLLTGSVTMNIEYGLRLRKIRSRAVLTLPVMRQLHLTGIAHQSAQTLSGGQAQLVALARSLVLRPDLLILDEPTANLDPARVALVEDVIRAARTATNVTTIWATHNLFQARRVADRIGLLWNGQLVEVTGTSQFFEAPEDRRTADFVSGQLVY